MTHKSRIVLFIFVILAAVGIAAAMLTDGQPFGAEAKPRAVADKASLTVEAVQPAQTTWPLTIATNGPLAAWQEATISAETGGLRITALHADVGSEVKRGQLLAELSKETVKADVDKAEAAVASARAALKEAKANMRRAEAVRESGALSKQQIEQYEIAEQRAEADVASAKAALDSARVRLAQTRITAVDDGVVSSRTATLGTVVNSGTELFRLVRGGRVEWRAEVDANQLTRLDKGQSATVTVPGGTAVEGTVRQLSPTLDPNTRTGIAYVDLPSEPQLRPGMYVQGRIALGERPAMTLPGSAITLRDGRSYVFEIDPQRNSVIQREVVTGRTQGERIEIVSGIQPTTPVVLSGGAFLHDGDAVRIVNAGAAQ